MMEKHENPQNGKTMTCSEFQDKLPEMFESGKDLSSEQHLQKCETCAALVRDLEYIAQQAKLLLPLHDPSPAVWNHIQSAIQQDDGQPAPKSNETSTK